MYFLKKFLTGSYSTLQSEEFKGPKILQSGQKGLRPLKLSDLESFRALKLLNLESFRAMRSSSCEVVFHEVYFMWGLTMRLTWDSPFIRDFFTCPVAGWEAVYDEIEANSVQLNWSWDWTELGKIIVKRNISFRTITIYYLLTL